jgi:hypothetical protein
VFAVTITDIIIAFASVVSMVIGVLIYRVYQRQAVIMTKQVCIADRQTVLIDKQTTINHQNYLATHRPRLYISGVQVTNDFEIVIAVRNRGPNHAKEIRFDAVYAIQRNGYRVAPWTEELQPNQRLGPTNIERGVTAFYRPSPSSVSFLTSDIREGMDVIFLIGRMSYEDDGGVLRNTGFGWQYDPEAERFDRPDTEDEYNYED